MNQCTWHMAWPLVMQVLQYSEPCLKLLHAHFCSKWRQRGSKPQCPIVLLMAADLAWGRCIRCYTDAHRHIGGSRCLHAVSQSNSSLTNIQLPGPCRRGPSLHLLSQQTCAGMVTAWSPSTCMYMMQGTQLARLHLIVYATHRLDRSHLSSQPSPLGGAAGQRMQQRRGQASVDELCCGITACRLRDNRH